MANRISDFLERLTARQITLRSKDSSIIVDVNDSGELNIRSTKNDTATIVTDRLKFKDGTYIASTGGSVSLYADTNIFKYSFNGNIIDNQHIELKVVKSSNIDSEIVFTFFPNPTNDIELQQINSTTWRLIPSEFEKADSDILEITATAGTYSNTVKIYKVRDGDTGPVGPAGAQGPTGSAGLNSKIVKLSIDDAQIAYLSNGTTPTPTQITVTANTQNHSDGAIYYEFVVYEEGQASGLTLANTTSNTIILTNTNKNYGAATYTFINNTKNEFKSKTIKVVTREGQSNSSAVSEDSLPIIATKDGSDVLEVNFPNNNHTFPSDKDGNIAIGDYLGGGSTIEAYIGNEQLIPTSNSSLSNGQFKVQVTSRRDITEGSIIPNTNATLKRMDIGDPSNMTISANTAEIVYLISGIDSKGISKTKSIKASFTKSKKGTNGADGADGVDGADGRDTASIFDFYSTHQYNDTIKVPYGWNITPSSSVPLTIDNYLVSELTPKFEPSGGFKYPELTGSGYIGSVSGITRGLTTISSADSIYGGNVARFSIQSISSSIGTNEAYMYTAEAIPISEGNTYELSYRINRATDRVAVYIGLFFFDQDGNLITSTNTNPINNTISYAQTSFPHIINTLNRAAGTPWTANKVLHYYSYESGGSLKTFPSTAKYVKPYIRIKFIEQTNSAIMRTVLVDYLYFGIKTTPNKRSGIFIDEITGRVSIGESNADIAGESGDLTTSKYDSYANFEIVSSNTSLEPQDVCDIKITRAHAYQYDSASYGNDVAIGRDFAALRFAGWTGTFLGSAASNMVIDERAEIRATYNRAGGTDQTYGALGGASLDFYTSRSRNNVLLNNTNNTHTKPVLRARITDQGQFLIGYKDANTEINPNTTISYIDDDQNLTSYTFDSTNTVPKLAVLGTIYTNQIIIEGEGSSSPQNLFNGYSYFKEIEPINSSTSYIGSATPFKSIYSRQFWARSDSTNSTGLIMEPGAIYDAGGNWAISRNAGNFFIPIQIIGDLKIQGISGSTPTEAQPNCLRLIKHDDTLIYWDIFIHRGDGQSGGLDGGDLAFFYNNVGRAYIVNDSNLTKLNFTGQHRNIAADNLNYKNKIGMIVLSAGEYSSPNSNSITINESLPKIILSNKRNQKNVFGVISDSEDPDSNIRNYSSGRFVSVYEKDLNDNRLIINSLGEGAIWVCNINGNFENGDYITTCEIPGYGMKQDDDLLHNYTVAKITCDCDFNLESAIYICEEFEFEGKTYRRAFVGCTYHCG